MEKGVTMKIPIRKFTKMGRTFLIKHSADILTGFTAAGVVLTAITTHKATLKADEYLRVNGYDKANPDTRKVLRLNAAKHYIAPVAVGAVTIGAAIGANYINHKHIAGLAAACSIAETALAQKDDKITELLGAKTLSQIDDELMKDKGDRLSIAETTVLSTGHGNVLCIDGLTGLRLLASPEYFYATRNMFNSDINQTMYGSVADYAEYLCRDCKEPYYIPEWAYELGYGVHTTGLFEYKTPHWEGDADHPAYVIFEPVRQPIHNFAEIL